MIQKGLAGFFENFLKKESLFIDKKVLQSAYTPESIPHRNEQMKQIAEIIAPALKLERPSNIFIYGKSGTGKTLTTRYTSNELMKVAKQNNVPLRIFYLNCKLKKIADTEYRLVAQLVRGFGKTVPTTGLPTEEVYKIFFNSIDDKNQLILLVLDEIDQLVKKTGDGILYNLTRINEELKNCQISLIGISNNLTFIDNVDPRVKSSLSEEELVFPPYNALQIQDILQQRARKAFKENVVGEGVIEKCAAYAAREHGDARRALELLRVAGEIAERNNHLKILTEHIDLADEKIERDKLLDLLTNQPKQFQSILYSIVSIRLSKKSQTIFTGEVYEFYKKICSQTNLRPLTQRRVSDIISELDMLGIITARVISKGRYGRTREILLSTPNSSTQKIKKILEEALSL
jgi:cell division control protein 6